MSFDLKKIVEQNLKLWGFLPYDRYVFFNFVVNSGGGLEQAVNPASAMEAPISFSI